MKRPRLLIALVLALTLVGTLAGSASASTQYRKLNGTGWQFIYAGFVHNAPSECPSEGTTGYKVDMRLYLYWGGGQTFTVQDVDVTYRVTTGRTWADSFVIFGSYNVWPTTGAPVHQGAYLTAGQSRTFHYHPAKVFKKDATLENQSFYDIPGSGCNIKDDWAVWIY